MEEKKKQSKEELAKIAEFTTEISMETIREMHKGILALIQSDERNVLVKRQAFQDLVERNPQPQVIKTHPYMRNVKYLPISHVEGLLDALFFGQWDTKNFSYLLIGNELSGSIELCYQDPITMRERTIVGAAAEQIQVNALDKKVKQTMSQEELSQYALDLVNNKKPAALVGAIGTLKTDCLKNAAKSIGNCFGRSINRKIIATPFNLLPNNVDEIKKILDEKK